MSTTPRAHRLLRRSDVRGLVHLAVQATEGVAQITEGVHQSVWRTLGVAGRGPQRTGGLTGLVYRSIGSITRGVGWGLDRSLAVLERSPGLDADAPDSPRRLAWLAALNGVMGDRLAASRHPLAIEMSLRRPGGARLDLRGVRSPPSGRRILLLVHGLCMNDLQWQAGDADSAHDHGRAVADALGYEALYLRYNTGRAIWRNGDELATRLEDLLLHGSAPIDELSVLSHSMGGLVMRSAIDRARRRGLAWPARLRHVVFLGTPHHGAPLERAGHVVERMLAATHWSAPFVRLAALRSAGITDLRHGRVVAPSGADSPDAHDADASAVPARDGQAPLPLPAGVACHTVAATIAARRSTLADRLIGDGLVPLDSALGHHADPLRRLAFADASSWICYRTGHLALLSRPAVADRIVRWLGG